MGSFLKKKSEFNHDYHDNNKVRLSGNTQTF